jgi:copper homeostasis protein
MLLEVCATSLQSAINAQSGGAERIELCDNLYEGGTTPSPGTIQLAREKLTIKVHVLIRPRGSDFVYSDEEMEVICKDIEFCKSAGCDGVVIGFLHPDGTIDTVKTKEIIQLARPMSVTFHRAFDMTRDPFEALDALLQTGVDRLLTAGQQNKAPLGANLIAGLIKKAGKRLVVMPGSGVNEENIRWLYGQTGAVEFHMTGQKPVFSMMNYRKEGIFLGGLSQIPEYEYSVTSVERIRKTVEILKGLI